MTTIKESTKVTLTIGQIKRLIAETIQPVNEAGIALGGQAYPKDGNVLILAGGAGSGKGFIRSNVLLFDGKLFDVDDVKPKLIELAKRNPNSPLAVRFQDKFGYSLANVDQKNTRMATDLHTFSKDDEQIYAKTLKAFSNGHRSASNASLPNLIFDDPLKRVEKLKAFCDFVQDIGYKKENIHLVWVVNSFEQASINNIKRGELPGGRTAPEEVMTSTHEGAAETMRSVFDKSIRLRHWLDGDIWVVFSKEGEDTSVVTTPLHLPPDDPLNSKKRPNPHVLEKYTAYQMKKKGEPVKSYREAESWVRRKIAGYVPAKVRRFFWGGEKA